MKLLFSTLFVAIAVFVVVAFASAIDNKPILVLLFPLAYGAVVIAKEREKKRTARDKRLNDFGSGLR